MSNVIMFPKQRIVRQIPVPLDPQTVAEREAWDRRRDPELSLLSLMLTAAIRKFKKAVAARPVSAELATGRDQLVATASQRDPRAGRQA